MSQRADDPRVPSLDRESGSAGPDRPPADPRAQSHVSAADSSAAARQGAAVVEPRTDPAAPPQAAPPLMMPHTALAVLPARSSHGSTGAAPVSLPVPQDSSHHPLPAHSAQDPDWDLRSAQASDAFEGLPGQELRSEASARAGTGQGRYGLPPADAGLGAGADRRGTAAGTGTLHPMVGGDSDGISSSPLPSPRLDDDDVDMDVDVDVDVDVDGDVSDADSQDAGSAMGSARGADGFTATQSHGSGSTLSTGGGSGGGRGAAPTTTPPKLAHNAARAAAST